MWCPCTMALILAGFTWWTILKPIIWQRPWHYPLMPRFERRYISSNIQIARRCVKFTISHVSSICSDMIHSQWARGPDRTLGRVGWLCHCWCKYTDIHTWDRTYMSRPLATFFREPYLSEWNSCYQSIILFGPHIPIASCRRWRKWCGSSSIHSHQELREQMRKELAQETAKLQKECSGALGCTVLGQQNQWMPENNECLIMIYAIIDIMNV